jgi:hypothetical protein
VKRPIAGIGLAALGAVLPRGVRNAIQAAVRLEEEDLRERALGVDPADEGVVIACVIDGRVYTAVGRVGFVMRNGSRAYVWLDGDATPRRIRTAGRS